MTQDETALEVALALRRGEGPTELLGIALEHVSVGHARASMVLTPATLNGHGNAHGGMLFLLADTAFAYACNSRNIATVAQAASIAFLSPGAPGELITAEASESAAVGRGGIYDVRLTGDDGRVVAIFQGISRSLGRPALPDLRGDHQDG
jgi:acyl-CoA thioesterase